MSEQRQKGERFRSLHVRGTPLVLFNVWDPGSAKAVAASGAEAIGTSSWSVGHANGFADGERTPLALSIDILRRIAAATELPVTIDLESGYGESPDAVGEAVALAIEAGAVGCNLEDSVPGNGSLRPLAEQVDRLRARTSRGRRAWRPVLHQRPHRRVLSAAARGARRRDGRRDARTGARLRRCRCRRTLHTGRRPSRADRAARGSDARCRSTSW